MNASAISMFVFGIYVLTVGVGYLLIPNKLLPMFKLPTTEEPWIRVMGAIVVALGFYYIVAAQNDLTVFYWATIVGRFWVFISFTLLVIAKKAKPILILFGFIDAAGAIWTMLTM